MDSFKLMYSLFNITNYLRSDRNRIKLGGIKMSLTAIGVGMAALAVIGGGLGIGFATSSAVKAIAQQPEAHGKIRSTLLIGAALAEATAIYGFVLGILIILMVK